MKHEEKSQLFLLFIEKHDVELKGSTIKQYEIAWKRWISYLEKEGITVSEANAWDARQFYEEMLSKYKVGTANLTVKLLSRIYSSVAVNQNPFSKVKRSVEQIYTPKHLSELERKRLLRATPIMRRNMRLAVLLGLLTGLRVSEISNLRYEDIKRNHLEIRGKMGRVRRIPLHPALREELEEENREIKGNEYVLTTERGPGEKEEKISVNGIYRLIKKAGELVGIENLHPHQLRHTFAIELLRRGAKITEVARLLGHTKNDGTVNISVVGRYLEPSEKELEWLIEKL